ncbi:DUF6765 family protein [Desulfitobacterium metallireducens]|uniref:Signal peptide protein n=1 Tax=Desulfitobacterium metallireducens DSM 15288 TaxID=871968 RepID=W0ED32_9FIRM|nr:DUF6765 family protein [Desulfitobacterium metallireducens]AHF07104.1 signal peptide protein [Desulfitobacterium metallireducens DSM 15288]
MKRDAHYYALLAFCRACGFSKESAQVIAYASQFVDDAKINLIYLDPENLNVQHDLVDHQPAFFNMATCHSYFRIETFNYEAMVNNTVAFHFVPGLKGENFTKRLRCTEESPIIMDIIKEVLLEDDLIKLGMVLHIYVDTFSHQGFSGIASKVNAIKNCEAHNIKSLGLFDRTLKILKQLTQDRYEIYFDKITPAYGHAQALDYPDLPYLKWTYEYDYSDEFNGSYKKVVIDNKDRYQRAFKGIQNLLETYLEQHQHYRDETFTFKNRELLMDALVNKAHDKDRIKNWQNVLVEQGLLNEEDHDLLSYEDDRWLKEAFDNYDRKVFDNRVVQEGRLADDFENSNWYGFLTAVKWYKEKFFDTCVKNQMVIPN